jgi:hypothetical protein
MKKFIVYLFFIFSFVGLNFTPTFAGEAKNTFTESSERSADQLVNRLHEIKEMDKSSLNKAEKKELRKEVKEIQKELKEQRIGRGVYISGAAIIIAIILLLVLI